MLLRQFTLDCRPFYVAGFNAHDVVPKSMAELYDHQTVGARRVLWRSDAFACRALL